MTKLTPIRFDYDAPSIEEDPHGEEALWEGSGYYDKAMSYTDPDDHEKRIRCFQAAEQLYLQSAERGNVIACLCLGYLYSYDRCEGLYWRENEDADDVYPREEWAFERFSIAAEAGIPEACYELGDLYKDGIGCKPDAASAYSWYLRASKLALNGEAPVILGSIALRLAKCFEEGFGCEQSFSCALQMYRHAADALEFSVENGEAWYEKALSDARAGIKRCMQETLDGFVPEALS